MKTKYNVYIPVILDDNMKAVPGEYTFSFKITDSLNTDPADALNKLCSSVVYMIKEKCFDDS